MVKKIEEENYRKFLKGAFWVKGWNDREKEILKAVPDENKVEVKKLLSELGEKIGREWAKDPFVRNIDSEMLKKWGGELKKAVDKGPASLVQQLRILECEVNRIISENA
jgi:DNA-binding transcriptional ArsR family regulator